MKPLFLSVMLLLCTCQCTQKIISDDHPVTAITVGDAVNGNKKLAEIRNSVQIASIVNCVNSGRRQQAKFFFRYKLIFTTEDGWNDTIGINGHFADMGGTKYRLHCDLEEMVAEMLKKP